ncbi:UDP-4-amino-4,6-dideoxy-N-acetyl-beta-L-altrosamine N-acetyltransferase [Vibrio sp. DW001]|uniref:UDP-4-amino-4, 6-dideoxy-N-acetyl-beta-L-altrosamine N-acetyltransferase n=1 Tax=Vibrio sp. DW001 TaxID=2912315 RepID=UPI0023AECCBB|nr:UDP-4-amino-4,6-dideoxy-N-acetyl-beta-L-altrosamine N-acetyltransferase [Vibrio sp. DW001]WED26858.1 UDP-4-amino-4,6-dideoxy-N-acetyl-beta-L-altrosamine N-acetyltransferase [Vibrio sp. DW001]
MKNYRIRPAVEADKWMVLEWRNHQDVRSVMLTDHLISKDEHSGWWDKTMQMKEREILVFESNDKPVGVVTIYERDIKSATAWWGFYLDNANLDQSERTSVWLELEQAVIGYADKTLKLHELYCESLKDNQLAWILHRKCGFTKCQAPDSATETGKEVVYMKYEYPHNRIDSRASLYLFASHNTDFLADKLRRECEIYPQFPYQVKQSEFGRYMLDLLDPNNRELNVDDAAYLFIERVEDFYPDIYTTSTYDALISIEERVTQYIEFIAQLASSRKNPIYVADFSLQKGYPHTLSERLSGSELDSLIATWNQRLYQLVAENGIHIIPYSDQIRRHGSASSFSNKFWYVARAPFSAQYLQAYSKAIIGSVMASNVLTARALVLDLDNTLWGGIIGDDGMEGIALGGDYPGNIYRDLQSLFLSLKEKGILLTVCSKNTESVALEAIEKHTNMRLRKDDFVTWRINWESKASNIQALAQELNLGESSLCFIDDNPVERAEVRRHLPNVFVPELPEDPAEWFEFISQLPELWVASVNDSDKRRAELYKKRVNIKKAESSFGDRESFLKSLEMEARLESLNADNFDRTYQLFSKTNQFNTTTTRYSKEQLKAYSDSENSMVIHVKTKDKYSSDFEGVAALVVHITESLWTIDNFVMSCRVMGRDIEKAILSKLLEKAMQSGVQQVEGRFIASKKNMPVESLYSTNSFQKANEKWLFSLTQDNIQSYDQIIKSDWVN